MQSTLRVFTDPDGYYFVRVEGTGYPISLGPVTVKVPAFGEWAFGVWADGHIDGALPIHPDPGTYACEAWQRRGKKLVLKATTDLIVA